MVFCYPKLSKFDLFFLRLGGPGLGNLLFPWARAKVLAKQNGYQFVPPTWPQLKLGPLLRGEIDSRSYFSLFQNLAAEVRGFQRVWILLCSKKIPESAHASAQNGQVVVTDGVGDLFKDILGYSEYLHSELLAMLQRNRLAELSQDIQAANCVAVHVRFGDFMAENLTMSRQGQANRRQPIEWYVWAVTALRNSMGANTPVNVFSDATDEELAPLLSLPHVRRAIDNSAIEDMLLMARHRVLVASGSTFSMWASFLGQVPTVWFPGQMKFRLVRTDRCEVELEAGHLLPTSFISALN